MISEKKSGAPYLNVWFGNFYRPAYDDQAFVGLVSGNGVAINAFALFGKPLNK